MVRGSENIDIKKSQIHSKGVFAKRNIKKGEFIIEYVGEIVDKKESDRRLHASLERHKKDSTHAFTYIFELNDTWDLDGDTTPNDAKYINHSCDPNCSFQIKDGHVEICAAREIPQGEELSYNYGFDVDEDYEDYQCQCGAKNCVGYMVAEEDWPELRRLVEKTREKKG